MFKPIANDLGKTALKILGIGIAIGFVVTLTLGGIGYLIWICQ